jgi:hypothetical protein
MRTFLFLVSMTIAVRHLRFSSSISLLSQTSKTYHFGTVRTYASKSQIYPSVFQTIHKDRGSSFRKYRHQQRTANSMTGVVNQDEKETMGNEENQCGERLRQGGLVAFPTETVYGLGCNALDPSAIIKVFEAKERPLTDPLITHVTENQVAFNLWAADINNSLEGKALQSLCKHFWPGPLTLVAKAAPEVPPTLMANTGFCACRSPQHPISHCSYKCCEGSDCSPECQ